MRTSGQGNSAWTPFMSSVTPSASTAIALRVSTATNSGPWGVGGCGGGGGGNPCCCPYCCPFCTPYC
ncbi:hypothetical protein DMT42_24815 [Streptomyces actuosus]|uniref:Uncharacterized protein n=1 Tax=Streptomyces actuosus TaxID=1885 RepID=A0A2U9P7K1_STRAS|nr:hypothetical protein DMT42_24815 [Streptomyces actuosus]